ncbi:hypothetical protein [Streptomyces mirabilis]|uniref:hypothetical protein n=1 Tax=Streptomyces mirabilis TaxID=68239 RepID=UPI0036DAA378
MEDAAAVDRRAIHEELEGARTTFHRLLDGATNADLVAGEHNPRTLADLAKGNLVKKKPPSSKP